MGGVRKGKIVHITVEFIAIGIVEMNSDFLCNIKLE